MSPDKIALVRSSWDAVSNDIQNVATLFYGKLFELVPETKAMFNTNLDSQGRKLMITLGVVIQALDNLEPLFPVIERLAIRHVEYGTLPEHYDFVGEALLWALEESLGDDFTDDAKDSWKEAYEALSSTMKEAAYGAQPV